VKSRKSWVGAYDKLTSAIDDLDTMYEFYKAGDATEADAEELYQAALKILDDVEFKNMLNSPDDALSCVLQINAGAGGTESCDWAQHAGTDVYDVG
jgi:peptide chain release factor 2